MVQLASKPEPNEVITTCPHCAAQLRYGDVVGIEIRGAYDGVLFWMCPRCQGAWHRWPEGHRLNDLANRYMYTGGAA